MRSVLEELMCIAGELLGSSGQQTRRKDRDLMRDTGGISKGRDREPSSKPPRDENKSRYRDKRLKPEQVDKDTNADKDRDVKKPNRRPQAALTTYTVYISKAYFPKEMWPKGIAQDAMYFWKVMGPWSKRSEVAQKVWQKHGEDILREVNPWVKRISLNVSGGTGMGTVETADRLSPIQVYPTLKASLRFALTDEEVSAVADAVKKRNEQGMM